MYKCINAFTSTSGNIRKHYHYGQRISSYEYSKLSFREQGYFVIEEEEERIVLPRTPEPEPFIPPTTYYNTDDNSGYSSGISHASHDNSFGGYGGGDTGGGGASGDYSSNDSSDYSSNDSGSSSNND